MLIKLDPTVDEHQYCAIIHHGGDHGVTGSCHEFFVDAQQSLLVDCGIFQGNEAPKGIESQEIDFDISNVKALLITHVHIDHVGRLPYLFAAGFRGPIFCTEASAKLLPLVMEDAVKVGFSANPRMVAQFLDRLAEQLIPVVYNRWLNLKIFEGTKVKVKFKPAGHILGSAYLELDVQSEHHRERTIFSGDLGAPYAPLLPAPKSPYSADRVVMESTYGDREHENRNLRKKTLKTILEKALSDRGTVIIPAFSIGRTQELLYELEDLIHHHGDDHITAGLPWDELEVIVDSPLASKFTEVYADLKIHWDREALRKVRAGRHPLSFDQLTTIDSHQEHLKTVEFLSKTKRPAIVIAASGMCSGGRVMNYLKSMIGDPRHDVLFVGYQAHGTPGHAIQKYGPRGGYVEIDGRRLDIKANVWTISGYSAHADQKNLVNFIKRMHIKPRMVKLIHGMPESKQELAKEILWHCKTGLFTGKD